MQALYFYVFSIKTFNIKFIAMKLARCTVYTQMDVKFHRSANKPIENNCDK